MQVHMRRLVEVTKDLDGFKENHDNIVSNVNLIGEYCYGRIRRKRILSTSHS